MLSKEVSREIADQEDSPQLLESIKFALQNFINDCARRGMKLPLNVTICDSDGDVAREFTIERNGKKTLGKTSDAFAMYTAPFTVVGIDRDGRIGILKIVPRISADAASVESNETEFVN